MKLKLIVFLLLFTGLRFTVAAEGINTLLNRCDNAPAPQNGWACYEAAEYYENNFNYQKAFEFYQKSYDLLPHREKPALALGKMYESIGFLKLNISSSERYKKAYGLYKESCASFGKACALMVRAAPNAGVDISQEKIRSILLNGCSKLDEEASDACYELAEHTNPKEAKYIFKLMCKQDPKYCVWWTAYAIKTKDEQSELEAWEKLCTHGMSSACAKAIDLHNKITK